MKMSRPDLVVPYIKQSTRDRIYPYIITIAIVVLTVLAIIANVIEGVA